jgi:hypothetical protein
MRDPDSTLTDVVAELDRVSVELHGSEATARVAADPENVERGLAQLVLTIVELLRQLMERQAIRRMEAGSLSDEEIERMGETFLKLERRMGELREHFGLSPEDLNLDLGPLGNLM